MQQKWYHTSPKRLPVNTILTGVFARSRPWEAKGKVFITASEIPHYSIIAMAVKENWHVYQVIPLEKKIFWGDSWDEATCLSAQIVRYVGTARGIVSSHIRHIPLKTKQKITEGVIDPNEVLQGWIASWVTLRQVTRWNRSRKEHN